MNEKENPVIVFDKYEIAPGAYGKLEFEIDKTGNMAERTGYTDNFMVPEEEITAFAGKVKEAVADRDMDALASLAPILCMWDLRTAAFRRGHRKNWLPWEQTAYSHRNWRRQWRRREMKRFHPAWPDSSLKKTEPRTLYSGYPRECWPLKELIIDGLILTNHT